MSEHDGVWEIWPSFTDVMSTMALILFVLVLLSFVRSLVSAKQLQAFQRLISTSEQQLRGLRAQVDAEQTDLADAKSQVQQQRVVIADSDRQLGTLRSQLQSIGVLRVEVLTKLKAAIEAQLGPRDAGGAELVTIGDNGNIVINERLVFEVDSYAIKKDARPMLDALARALGSVLDDPAIRENIDTIVIQGHTDARGSGWLNWDLSARRATAVLQYLFAANGALADAYGRYFSASAYSKFRPIDPGTTEAAYEQNRRIEISVVPKDDNVRKVIDAYVRSVAQTPGLSPAGP